MATGRSKAQIKTVQCLLKQVEGKQACLLACTAVTSTVPIYIQSACDTTMLGCLNAQLWKLCKRAGRLQPWLFVSVCAPALRCTSANTHICGTSLSTCSWHHNAAPLWFQGLQLTADVSTEPLGKLCLAMRACGHAVAACASLKQSNRRKLSVQGSADHCVSCPKMTV